MSDEDEPVDKLTLKELRDIARYLNLSKGYSTMNKKALRILVLNNCDIDGDMITLQKREITAEDIESVKKENTKVSDLTKKYKKLKSHYIGQRGKLNYLKKDLPYVKDEKIDEAKQEIKQLTNLIIESEKEMKQLEDKIKELKKK